VRHYGPERTVDASKLKDVSPSFHFWYLVVTSVGQSIEIMFLNTLFHNLEENELKSLEGVGDFTVILEEATVPAQDKENPVLYVLMSGELIYHSNGVPCALHDKRLSAGLWFGEVSFFKLDIRLPSIVFTQTGKVWFITRSQWDRFCIDNPSTSLKMHTDIIPLLMARYHKK